MTKKDINVLNLKKNQYIEVTYYENNIKSTIRGLFKGYNELILQIKQLENDTIDIFLISSITIIKKI
ncbi:MAG: hypothetical protein LBM96_06110 [Methanobrevibacter sp.]|jgi:hypothetical protein|nr:hypothetical protein [Candidatus Methanoflexus mossambicus]